MAHPNQPATAPYLESARDAPFGIPEPRRRCRSVFQLISVSLALNGRDYGPNVRFNVTGMAYEPPPPDVRFAIVENRVINSYYMYSWPLDEILGREPDPGQIEPLHVGIRSKLKDFRLVKTFERARGGAPVRLFERRGPVESPASTI